MFKKILFPLFVTAGLMFSGCSSFPFCCPESVLKADVIGLVFDWNDGTAGTTKHVTLTTTDQWLATFPAWLDVNPPNDVAGGIIDVTVLADNYLPTNLTGTIKFLSANGDEVSVIVTQNGLPVSDIVADNLEDIFNDFYNQGPIVPGHLTGSSNALAMDKTDPFYTLVMGGLTAAPTSVTLNGVALTSTPPMTMSIGNNYFVSFGQYLYDSGELYVATAILAVEAADSGNNLQIGVDGTNYNVVVDAPTGTVDIAGAGYKPANPPELPPNPTVSFTAPNLITFDVQAQRRSLLYIDYDNSLPLDPTNSFIITKRVVTDNVDSDPTETLVVFGVTDLESLDPAVATPGVAGRYGLGFYVFGWDHDNTDSATGATTWNRVVEYTNYLVGYGVAKVRIEAEWTH